MKADEWLSKCQYIPPPIHIGTSLTTPLDSHSIRLYRTPLALRPDLVRYHLAYTCF